MLLIFQLLAGEGEGEAEIGIDGWTDVPETMPAHDITIYGAFVSGISATGMDADSETLIYTLDGIRTDQPQRGLNIVRMSDGTMKKIHVK